MQLNVDDSVIQGLLSQAAFDGIQKLGVGAVVKQDGKVLLVERVASDFMGGFFEVPGGGVEDGEGLLAALAREVREESSLELTNVRSYIGSFDYVSSSGKRTREFNFLVDVAQGEVELNPEEHSSYYWVNFGDQNFQKLKISDETKAVLGSAS